MSIAEEYPIDIEVLHGEVLFMQDAREIHTLLARLSPASARRDLSETKAQLVEMSESNMSYLFVAKNVGQIVGMATINYVVTPSSTYGIADAVVKLPHTPRRVVGPALVEEVCQHSFESMGADHIQLTSNAQRSAARSLYQQVGFVIRDTDLFSLSKQDWIQSAS